MEDYGTTETEEVVDRLRRLGWVRREPACDCGCGPGQTKDCVVLYVQDGVVFHAAIFDHVHCDWGGKLSATGAIVRYRRAGDYLRACGDIPERAEMWFYCPRPASEGPSTAPADGEQKTDEWLHDHATSEEIWLECPSGAITFTRSRTRTRGGYSRRGARRRAGIAAARAVIAELDGIAAMHHCAEGCELVTQRTGSVASATYEESWFLRLPWNPPWECTATYRGTLSVRCVRP